jgi:hypothetical protein
MVFYPTLLHFKTQCSHYSQEIMRVKRKNGIFFNGDKDLPTLLQQRGVKKLSFKIKG